MLEIICLSLLWTILNACRTITTSLVTSMYGNVGFYMNGTMYLADMLGSILAPIIVCQLLGLKWTILMGSSLYLSYFLALNIDTINQNFLFFSSNTSIAIPLCVGAGLVGLGTGIIKSQQSVWISTIINESNQKSYMGIYSAIINSHGIIGFTFSYALLYFKINVTILIWILFFATIGVLVLMTFTKNPKISLSHFVSLQTVLFLIKHPKISYVGSITFYYALTITFSYGVMPTMISGLIDVIIFNFIIYSIVLLFSSYLGGIFYSKTNTAFIYLVIMLSSFLLLISWFLLYTNQMLILYPYSIIIIGVFAAINESLMSLMYIAETTRIFPTTKAIYSLNRTFYSFCCMILSISAIYLPAYVFIIALNVVIVVHYLAYK